jgi:hypothetical protein
MPIAKLLIRADWLECACATQAGLPGLVCEESQGSVGKKCKQLRERSANFLGVTVVL